MAAMEAVAEGRSTLSGTIRFLSAPSGAELAALAEMGVKVTATLGDLVTADLPLDRVIDVAGRADVVRIEASALFDLASQF